MVTSNALKKMKFKHIGQKIREEWTGHREELTQIDPQDFTGKQYDQLIVRNSISVDVFHLVVSIILIVFLLIPDDEGKPNVIQMYSWNWLWATAIALLPLTLSYLSIRALFDKTPQLTVDLNGIKTKEWELMWQDIAETKFRFLKGKTTFLIIKTNTDEKKVNIGNTNVGCRFLGHHIELLKKRAG